MKEYRRTDIVKKLPQEIVTLILNQLDFDDILNCIHVSKHWRQRVCDDSAIVRRHVILDVKTREKSGSFSSEFYKSSVRLLSSGVTNLEMNAHFDKSEQIEIVHMMPNMLFNNLRKLTIGKLKQSL